MAYLKMYGGRIQIGKTIDIYSAAVDTIYYMKNGVSVTLGTTDATGKLTVNKSYLRNGTYTLYSSVAKDPSNLSNAYSKSVTVDNNTEEIYLMPDGAVYWYGVKFSEYKRRYHGSNTTRTWTEQTNGIYMDATTSGSNYMGFVFTKPVDCTKASQAISVYTIDSQYYTDTGVYNWYNTGFTNNDPDSITNDPGSTPNTPGYNNQYSQWSNEGNLHSVTTDISNLNGTYYIGTALARWGSPNTVRGLLQAHIII